MNKYLTISSSTVLLISGLFLISSCSSSDDGGSSGGTVVPTNAVLINDSATAEDTLRTAIGTGDLITSAFGVEASTPLTAKDIIDIVFDKAKGSDQNLPDIAIGADLSSICITGTASGDETETDTSYSASITFNACEVEYDLFFTGSLTISSTWSNETSDYTDSASGDLTVTYNTEGIGFNGFNFVENGNEVSGDYTVTTFTYTINPSIGGGFAAQLTQPIVGNNYVSCGVTSGQVLVTGAESSQARATFNSDGSAKSEYHSGDGNFIETDNSPIPCLIY